MGNSDVSESDSLLHRASVGDPQARAELLGRYRGRLRRMIAIRLDPRLTARIDASDVVQDALNNAFARLPEYFADPQLSFYPWLRRIAWDRLVDMYRTHIGAEQRSVLKEEHGTLHVNDASVHELADCLVTSSFNPAPGDAGRDAGPHEGRPAVASTARSRDLGAAVFGAIGRRGDCRRVGHQSDCSYFSSLAGPAAAAAAVGRRSRGFLEYEVAAHFSPGWIVR